MRRIHLLNERTANRIAAGEVVTRPSAVIKELCENAIDAGAKKVDISIANGGMMQIVVTDDGEGIHPDDLALAFERHATGKTKDEDELFGMETLGFRGEALSSIAAVSKVQMISRRHGSDMAKAIELEGGTIVKEYETGGAEGTRIEVNDLFYNTPARKKFIKSIGAESASCAEVVSRLILAYPQCEIRFSNQGKMIFHSPGTELKDAILSVYGKEIYSQIIPVFAEKEDIRLEGYIGKPSISRRNRSYETIIINHRVVRHPKLTTAAEDAFSERMMVGKYPFLVLHIQMDPHRIDPNIHPQKQELKIQMEDQVCEVVYDVIQNALQPQQDLRTIKSIETEAALTTERQAEEASEDFQQEKEHLRMLMSSYLGRMEMEEAAGLVFARQPAAGFSMPPMPRPFSGENAIKSIYGEDNFKSFSTKETKETDETVTLKTAREDPKGYVPLLETPASNDFEKKQDVEEQASFLSDSATFKIIGQVFLTYLLVQAGDVLYVIDQHAAHERINYDKLMQELKKETPAMQMLLAPLTLSFSPLEVQRIMEAESVLKEIGFEISGFGATTIAVRAVPAILAGNVQEDCILAILEQTFAAKTIQPNDALRESLIRACCRMSIKAGQMLGKEEIGAIILQLKEGKKLTCPHGRPIVLTIDKHMLERNFRRVQ